MSRPGRSPFDSAERLSNSRLSTLAQCHAVVIGVGIVGRQVALQLATMGVPKLTLIDHDTVAVENLAPQEFWESDVGRTKVEAVVEIAKLQLPEIEVIATGVAGKS